LDIYIIHTKEVVEKGWCGRTIVNTEHGFGRNGFVP
jgi:hypothetical protein